MHERVLLTLFNTKQIQIMRNKTSTQLAQNYITDLSEKTTSVEEVEMKNNCSKHATSQVPKKVYMYM